MTKINTTAYKVEEFYDCQITKNRISRFWQERPKLPNMSPQESTSHGQVHEVLYFDLSDGGWFIADDYIDSKMF